MEQTPYYNFLIKYCTDFRIEIYHPNDSILEIPDFHGQKFKIKLSDPIDLNVREEFIASFLNDFFNRKSK